MTGGSFTVTGMTGGTDVDSRFLKFWGKCLLQVAEGSRPLEELNRWMQSGLAPSGDLASLWRQCYGLPDGTANKHDALWRKTTADFRAMLEAYAPLWGWIPADRYDQLKRKTERLETTVAEQARLIKQLEALLENRNMGNMSMVTRFQNVIEDQNQAFEKLMQSLVPSAENPDETDA